MRPSYKKWRALSHLHQNGGPRGPFQVALFIRTEEGRTIDIAIDEATDEMKQAALELLNKLSE